MFKRIIKCMNQIVRMYRLVKIIENMEVEVSDANKKKSLIDALESGYRPSILVARKKFEQKYNYSHSVSLNAYNDALSAKYGFIAEDYALQDLKKQYKMRKYVHVTTEGRTLLSGFIIPWGLFGAIAKDNGYAISLVLTLLIGVISSPILHFVWNIVLSVLGSMNFI